MLARSRFVTRSLHAPPLKPKEGIESHRMRTRREAGSRTGEPMADPLNSGQRKPDPNEKLIKVFDSEDESEALVVKGMLDAAGIDNDLTAASMVQDTFPGLGGMIILVREEDAAAARRVIADHPTLSDDDDTDEVQTTEEPPSQA